MNQIIRTYMSIFLILIIVITGSGLIMCALDAQRAEKLNSSYADVIAAHNYSDSAVNACIGEAAGNNYTLMVSKYDTNADGYPDICECVLEYDYSLGFLNAGGSVDTKHHVSRITR